MHHIILKNSEISLRFATNSAAYFRLLDLSMG
jgi:hypothetical protein